MKRYGSLDPSIEAWIDVPDEWTLGHYMTYNHAYSEMFARNPDATVAECKIAGALALIAKGDVQACLPGVNIENGDLDITSISMMSFQALLEAVAGPLSSSQSIPFGWLQPSEIGSTEAPKSKNGKGE